MIRKLRTVFLIIAALSAMGLIAGCGSGTEGGGDDTAGTAAAIPADGNIQASIIGVTIASPPVVTFTLRDQNGAALEPNAFVAAGGTLSFTMGQLDPATGHYQNYIKAVSAGQPGFDTGGAFSTVGEGVYTYSFATDIKNPALTLGGLVFDSTRTHTVAAQISRTITSVSGAPRIFKQAANPYLNFRPDGGAVAVTREVVAVSNCNDCHGTLGSHGGGRREIALCILCHYPGVTDPGTGDSIAFRYMVHKIHMGATLPSNWTSVGGNFTVGGTSFKTVSYPALSGDSRITRTPVECVKCHRAGRDSSGNGYGADADKWKEAPTRA